MDILMLIALLCFVLAFFGVAIGGHSLLILGFVFMAASFLVGGRRVLPWGRSV